MNRVLLEQKFSPEQIKQRRTDRGDTLDYIEGALVIQRLNEAFLSEWSFEITEHHVDVCEVWVMGKLTAAGISKTQFGKSEISRDPQSDQPISRADDLKAAATDALKKCATLFGVGLHLYFDGVRDPIRETTTAPAATASSNGNGNGNGHSASPYPLPRPNPPQSHPTSNGPSALPPPGRSATNSTDDNDTSRVSTKQLGAIHAIAKAAGWTKDDIRGHSKDTYGKMPDFLSKKEASTFIDYLKAGTR